MTAVDSEPGLGDGLIGDVGMKAGLHLGSLPNPSDSVTILGAVFC